MPVITVYSLIVTLVDASAEKALGANSKLKLTNIIRRILILYFFVLNITHVLILLVH